MIETHTFDRLFTFITELNAKNENAFNFVLCGDMNAHTSDSCDFVSNDSSFHIIDNLPADYCTDVFLKRNSKDKGRTNNNGVMLLDLCKQTGLRI